MSKAEKAIEYFMGEYNCAQSVLISFSDDFGYSKELAAKLASGFGGGIGKTQSTCGAVTGAVMVLGMKAGEVSNNSDELKERSYSKVKQFIMQFEADFRTTNCGELTGCDFSTKEGDAQFKEQNVKADVCAKCVGRAVEIIDELS